jgi:hypothetical protein
MLQGHIGLAHTPYMETGTTGTSETSEMDTMSLRWRAIYTPAHRLYPGERRKGPWFPSKAQAQKWVRLSLTTRDLRLYAVRYEGNR